jgi:hypothetical protein
MPEPVICPACDVPMNHHADKLRDATEADVAIDPDFGAVVEEFHCCPECGGSAVRAMPRS